MKFDLLKAERIKHGWTQAKVAEAVGVDAKTVGRWERGKALPYPYYREQLCLLFGKTAQQLGLSSADENDLSVPISASQVHEQKSPESAMVIKRQLEQILISEQDEPIRSTWIEPAPDMVVEANDLLLQERMALFSSYCSPTSYPSPIDPQTKPPVQEGKSRPRLLGRRSVLIGLVGGIIAIGGGVFVQGNTIVPAQPTTGGSTHWTDPQWIAGQGSQTTPALAISSSGTLHLIFVANDGNGLMYTSSQDNGATWDTYHAVRQSSKATPALAISPNGMLHLVFVANNSGNGLLYTSSQDNGATWDDTSYIGQDSKTAPALTIGKNGTLHLVFVANNSGNGLMYMSSQDYGATWDDVSYTGQDSKIAPALTIGKNGTLHLAFVASDGSNQLCIISSQDGIHWSTKQETGQSSLFAPALAALNNKLYLAFIASDGSNQLCIISSQDSIHWSSEQETGQSSLFAPALAALNNTLYLAFVASDGSNQICIISSFG